MPGDLNERIRLLREQLAVLRNRRIEGLEIPAEALVAFEPSQIAVIVNTFLDATLPIQPDMKRILKKHKGDFYDRETYPDYDAPAFDLRVELKGHFCEKASPPMKTTRSRREPSARLREPAKDIERDRDVLLVVAWRLKLENGKVVPVITDCLTIGAWEAVEARDRSLIERGGQFGPNGLPLRLKRGRDGTKAADFELDDNFGKLKRIPHPELKRFLKKNK